MDKVLPWIQTYSGKKFDLLNPTPESISIFDIAHALSNICRYTGHTKEFYSVAQHSVLASVNVPPKDALAGLLHDATEAYLTDISKPLKMLLPEYCKLEDKIYKIIAAKFGLPAELPASVKEADLRLLATEKRDLLEKEPDEWTILNDVRCYPDKITPWTPEEAKKQFLVAYTIYKEVIEACSLKIEPVYLNIPVNKTEHGFVIGKPKDGMSFAVNEFIKSKN